jgi:protein-S-isoprenylcysteine O-methyltransferase Ste14
VAAGISLLGWCVREFLVVGRGTLAPWWPPQQLVTSGPFALSRNPMYVAMAAIALGWAVTYWSRPLFIYASILICAFHVRILLGEEPTMAREFAGTWTNYAARVPRWIGRAAVRQQVEHSQRDQ